MKILIIRFSSIGDVLQCLSVAGALAEAYPGAEIDWVTREDLRGLVEEHPQIRKVFTINKQNQGFKSLMNLASELRAEKYDRVYDAHNNLRSHLIAWFMFGPFMLWGRLRGVRFLRRKIPRWKRFFLFRFRLNFFRQPFSGQRDLLEPLKAWGLSEKAPPPPQLFLTKKDSEEAAEWSNYVALAPSAAYPLKRWPLDHWKKLIELLPEQKFLVLGGKEDEFLFQLEEVAPERVKCLAGQLNLAQSASRIEKSQLLVANDTGLLHMAEQLGRSCVALMGPAPFGFPSREKTQIMELKLSCRPCSKHGQGPCVNPEFQKCLAGISPEAVANEVHRLLMGEK